MKMSLNYILLKINILHLQKCWSLRLSSAPSPAFNALAHCFAIVIVPPIGYRTSQYPMRMKDCRHLAHTDYGD